LLDQRLDDCAALAPDVAQISLLSELIRLRGVSDDQTAESAITDQNVGTEPEDEVGYIVLAGCEDGIRERIGRRRFEQKVGGAANSKRRVRGEGFVPAKMSAIKTRREAFECYGVGAGHDEDERNYERSRDANEFDASR
jgi:hypothetical protein